MSPVKLSVAIITFNEEHNIARTLESVKWADEIVVVDSGSTDRTCEIARQYGAKVIIEPWRGFAAQKNFSIEQCSGDWILSLDADEVLDDLLQIEIAIMFNKVKPDDEASIQQFIDAQGVDPLRKEELAMAFDEFDIKPDRVHSIQSVKIDGFFMPRRNFFLGRWLEHGGLYPDTKLRLFRKGKARFKPQLVHESMECDGSTTTLKGALDHYSYPNLSGFIEHLNRYSSLGAEMAIASGPRGFNPFMILLNPLATFIKNYIFRLGFLDGREGLLWHLYHAVYVSLKYAKAWELSRKK